MTTLETLHTTPNPYLQRLALDVKHMGVKHVRKMFVLLRTIGADLHLSDMEQKTDWASYEELNVRLQTLVVPHGLTLGEFATGYVLNIQSRQRPSEKETPAAKKQPFLMQDILKAPLSNKRKQVPLQDSADANANANTNNRARKNKK